MTDNTDKLLTIKEAASWLQLNPITLYTYIRLGTLKAVKFGRYYRILQSDITQFINTHKVEPRI